MSNKAIEIYTKRRSQYVIGNDLPISQEETTALIKEAVRQAPSSFNSQSSRAVILFGEQHDKFWQIVMETLRKIVPADSFAPTEKKVNSFIAGAGTVLFFEDQDVIKGLQEQFALYADNFPVWSEHSTGIAQFAVWTALAEANIGATLQHYNPIIDDAVAETFNIPASWKLRAQMPFGSNEAPFGEKTFIDDEQRFMVFS
ncbi:nitroreductase family protein [Halomonas dongshanensis]|uniref:Nitroreductase family protein n=1 Tax=Halomonas dongshanensis TaxID=2890835 RepID=A0ABT2EAF1_9GAMM|nr:nitroreductase family protein [Halomonas dongshanensis]MCS2608552.1 nitroreductase family protein [Halomonas dongshanensis]